jgi:hypothetical protein
MNQTASVGKKISYNLNPTQFILIKGALRLQSNPERENGKNGIGWCC